MLQRLRQLRQLSLERFGAQLLKHIPQELEVHGTHSLDLGGAQIEFTLLLLDAVAHGFDHRGVLAPQAAQLGHLVVQIPATNVNHPPGLCAQAGHPCGNCRPQYGSAPTHNAFGQGFLQNRQTTGFKQNIIRRDLGNQPLLGGYGDHPFQRHAQHLCRCAALALHLGLHLLGAVQRIPQRVDLVQHDEPRIHAVGRYRKMLTPDRKIRAGDASISTQNENHRMRLRDQVDGQLGLCAHGIQAGSVQNHQPLLEQRVGNVDDGVPPHGHFHQALGIGHRVLIGQLIVPKTQRSGIVQADLAHLGHFLQGLGDLVRIANIQGNFCPAFGLHPPLGKTLHLQTGFDG